MANNKKGYPFGYQPEFVLEGNAGFVNLINPFKPKPDDITGIQGLPSYQILLLIPKTDEGTLKVVQEHISLMKNEIERVDGMLSDELRTCLKDGNKQAKQEAFKEHWMFKASMKAVNGFRPKLFTRDLKLVDPTNYSDDNTFIYPGCRVKIQVQLWYSSKVQRIAANLRNVQFVEDGEKLALGTGGGGSNTLFTNLDAGTEDIPF